MKEGKLGVLRCDNMLFGDPAPFMFVVEIEVAGLLKVVVSPYQCTWCCAQKSSFPISCVRFVMCESEVNCALCCLCFWDSTDRWQQQSNREI